MQRKKLRRRKRPQLSVWGASVQDIADARGSTSGQTCRDAREASGLAGRGLTRYGPIPLVQFQFYAIRTNVQVLFYTIPKKRNPAALWGRAAGNPKKKG